MRKQWTKRLALLLFSLAFLGVAGGVVARPGTTLVPDNAQSTRALIMTNTADLKEALDTVSPFVAVSYGQSISRLGLGLAPGLRQSLNAIGLFIAVDYGQSVSRAGLAFPREALNDTTPPRIITPPRV